MSFADYLSQRWRTIGLLVIQHAEVVLIAVAVAAVIGIAMVNAASVALRTLRIRATRMLARITGATRAALATSSTPESPSTASPVLLTGSSSLATSRGFHRHISPPRTPQRDSKKVELNGSGRAIAL